MPSQTALRKLIGFSAFLFLFAAGLVSQTTDRGSVIGSVIDQAGKVVPQAQMDLKHVPSGRTWHTTSDAKGKYTFAALPAGGFELTVRASGYRRLVQNFDLAAGQTFRNDVLLEPGDPNAPAVVKGEKEVSKTIPQQGRQQQAGESLGEGVGSPVSDANGPPPLPSTLATPAPTAKGKGGGGGGGGFGGGKGGPGGGGGAAASGGIAGGAPAGAPQLRGGRGGPGGGPGAGKGGRGGGPGGFGMPSPQGGQQAQGYYDDFNVGRRYTPGVPGNEQYGHYIENEFVTPQREPLSTFSTDVDTASYSNVRRFLTNNQLPPAESVRIEELVNYFHYDYPLPQAGKPVSMTTHLMKSPWNPRTLLLHVGVRTKPIAAEDLPPSHLTFLIDVSGSMAPPERLPLVRQAMQMLTRQLRPQDTVGVVVYAGNAGVVLPPTHGDHQQAILDAVGRLEAGGSTNGAEGIKLAYQLARQAFSAKSNNRVILATDGDFNVGVSSDDELVRLIEQERRSGVFLSVLGVGTNNLKDRKMEQLADHGNGHYAYLDSLAEARKVLVQEMGATLMTVAKDVKLQIEFNPVHVKEYRLVGYENRMLQPEDFADDRKDAGDLGAGHEVTAFYEIIPADSDVVTEDGLRYQGQERPAASTGVKTNELGWLKLRFKQPQGATSELMEQPMGTKIEAFRNAPADVRFGVAVAEYGLLLRHSRFAGNANFDRVMTVASEAMGQDLDGYRADFIDLVRRAANLSGATISRR